MFKVFKIGYTIKITFFKHLDIIYISEINLTY